MTLRNYAIVDTSTGHVVNLIQYEAQPPHPIPGFENQPNLQAIQSDVAGPGWTYSNGVFTPPQT